MDGISSWKVYKKYTWVIVPKKAGINYYILVLSKPQRTLGPPPLQLRTFMAQPSEGLFNPEYPPLGNSEPTLKN